MKVIFDHGTPRPLRNHLTGHAVDTAAEKGWSELSNGDLLEHAEKEGYEVLVTPDQNIRHQQNLIRRRIAVLVLRSNRWPRIRPKVEEVAAALACIQAGEIKEVPI